MRLVLLACALSLFACASDDNLPIAPPGGGGGSGGGGGGSDAMPGGGDSAVASITGQLCLIEDLQQPTVCASGDLTGIPVEDGTSNNDTFSDEDGKFTLPAPLDGSVIKLKVGFGSADYRSVVILLEFKSTDNLVVPLVAQTTWDSAIDVSEPDGSASIIAYLQTNAGTPLVDAVVVGPTGGAVLYDDGMGGWQSGGSTGTKGTVILLDIPVVPEASFSVTVDGDQHDVTGVPVIANALTFVEFQLPPST